MNIVYLDSQTNPIIRQPWEMNSSFLLADLESVSLDICSEQIYSIDIYTDNFLPSFFNAFFCLLPNVLM